MKIKLNKLFSYSTGNLPALELTEDGKVPLVYGTTKNNGVIKLVKVYENTKVYKPPLITVSYLGNAFVQVTEFTTSVVDKSNITVLIPREKMSLEELYYYAYQINNIGKFGFNYGRRMNQKQLDKMYLNKYEVSYTELKFDILDYLKKASIEQFVAGIDVKRMIYMSLDELFYVEKGAGEYKENYEYGTVPLISATTMNNGITAYVSAKPLFKAGTITVERIKGTAFVQLKDYVTVPDDINVLVPKKEMSLEVLYYCCFLIRRESWKYSYGRKVTPTRLKQMQLLMPINKDGEVEYATLEIYMRQHYGWNKISEFFHS